MVNIGYIVYDSHPLLQTISPEDISLCTDKPIIIIGVANASLLYPNLNLENKHIINNVYYTFSPRESNIKYEEHINEFVEKCFQIFISDIKVSFLIDIKKITLENELVFIHTTDTKIIVSTSREIFVLNKNITQYFNSTNDLEYTLIKKLSEKNQVVSWNGPNYFQAYLKSNNLFFSEHELKVKTKHINNSALYLGYLCLTILKKISIKPNIELWQRAFKIENLLSSCPIKIDIETLNKHIEQTHSSILQNIYSHLNKNYVIQKCNGTDKLTGRIYPTNSISLQTLPKEFRDIVIPNNNSKLFEIDYKYFEYYLLNQLCDMKIEGDPHEYLSIKLFGDKTKRHITKGINYSLMYGKNIDKILFELKEQGIDVSSLKMQLQEFIKPINEFSLKLEEEFSKKGEIKNYFGRNIYPGKSFALLNNYIQSTAADFIIIKLDKIFNLLEHYPKSNILFQNHDSIILSLHNEDLSIGLLNQIISIMCSSEKKISALVDIKSGVNWKDIS
jgi:hypothetical protein